MAYGAYPDPHLEAAANLEAARLIRWATGDPEREDALVEATAAILRAGGSDTGARNLRNVAYRALNRQRRTLERPRRPKD